MYLWLLTSQRLEHSFSMLHFSGQVNGWTALPSTYAIEAQDENDVVNAVKFAKDNNLRLVVKGTGNKTDSKVTNSC